jgi:hypothetical protein
LIMINVCRGGEVGRLVSWQSFVCGAFYCGAERLAVGICCDLFAVPPRLFDESILALEAAQGCEVADEQWRRVREVSRFAAWDVYPRTNLS